MLAAAAPSWRLHIYYIDNIFIVIIAIISDFIVIIFVIINVSTVKPVYNGHPWDPKKVAVV